MTESIAWVTTQEMAAHLGIGLRTLFKYMKLEGLFIEGRHYKRKTPKAGSPWLWNAELTQRAWETQLKPVGGAA